MNPSQRKKAAKERAKLAEKMKAKYGPTLSTIDQVVASLVPYTDTQPTICSPDCKCAAHNGLANRPARGNEGRQLPGNVVAALAVRTDDTPRPGVDPPHIPSHTQLTESEDILHPVCVKPSGIKLPMTRAQPPLLLQLQALRAVLLSLRRKGTKRSRSL